MTDIKSLNEVLKEDILDKIESMTVHEFQELLDKHYFKALNQNIDEHMGMLIEKIFEERSE